MSIEKPLLASADAAASLYEEWRSLADSWGLRPGAPSLLELQTVCRETGLSLPELDAFARVSDKKPAVLLCGGDRNLATEIAAIFGYKASFPALPDVPVAWYLDTAKAPSLRVRRSGEAHDVGRKTLITYLTTHAQATDLAVVEERLAAPSSWSFIWIPYPRHLHTDVFSIDELEILLAQRGSVALIDDTPDGWRKVLAETGQKSFAYLRDDAGQSAVRHMLLDNLAQLRDGYAAEKEMQSAASWQWLTGYVLDQIADKKRYYQQVLAQHQMRLSTTRHLLSQYRTNWTSGVRSITESYLQTRTSGAALAPFWDTQKPGPQADTFMAAIALPALWTKLDEYLTDRLADFLAGLSGLAAKLELHRVTLGEAKGQWEMRSLGPRLEALMREKQIFPDGGGKKSGLVQNLTGRKQAVVDERKAQVARATRIVTQAIEKAFGLWCGQLMEKVESGILVQLAAALANQGLSHPEVLDSALVGLDRIEHMLRGDPDAASDAGRTALEWMELIARERWIPLYQPH